MFIVSGCLQVAFQSLKETRGHLTRCLLKPEARSLILSENTLRFITKNNDDDIIAVCSEDYMKALNTLCGWNAEQVVLRIEDLPTQCILYKVVQI